MIDNYIFTKDKITQLLIKTSLKVHLQYDRGALYKYTEIPVIQKILDHLGDMSHESRGSIIERVRNYVYGAKDWNSANDEYADPPGQIGPIVTAIYRYREGIRKEPAGLSSCALVCAMSAILHHLGIMSRHIAVYSTSSDVTGNLIQHHILLDVFNSDSQLWELHDPTFDVGYGIKDDDGVKFINSMNFFTTSGDRLCHISGKEYYPNTGKNPDLKKLYTQYFQNFRHIVVSDCLRYGACAILNIEHVDIKKCFPGHNNQNIIEYLNTILIHPTLIGISNGRMCGLSPQKSFIKSSSIDNTIKEKL